ncbi:hypothetical protein QUF54_02720 [Candidatus Marithioploca araucensis]|uniref:DUF1887 family protein n=1 Tax=Candidatus Marithioploca araucensis TaxID=70273 RepID=A0ABT7VRG7_9GAMM|nr:hypothetical protein [Candidatus Marithioploca araucensis]
MAIFRCNKCGHLREVPNQHIGKKVKCPACKQMMPIHDTLHFIKNVLIKYFRVRKELSSLQEGLSPTATQVSNGNNENAEIDIFNTTVMTESQQYEPILKWFEHQQIQIKVDEEAVDTTGFFDEVAVKLGDNYDLLKTVSDKIKRIQNKGYTNMTLNLSDYSQEEAVFIKEFCQELHEYAFVAKYFVKRRENKIHLSLQTAQPIMKFFNGEWLEWFAFMKLMAFCHEHQISFSGLRSFTIHFPEQDKNELDTFFLIKKTIPVFVECKSGEFRQFVDKYSKLRKRLKIDKKQFLMLVVGLSDEQTQGLTSMFDITIVNEKNFVQHVSTLMH